jgi:hypothetical protein
MILSAWEAAHVGWNFKNHSRAIFSPFGGVKVSTGCLHPQMYLFMIAVAGVHYRTF